MDFNESIPIREESESVCLCASVCTCPDGHVDLDFFTKKSNRCVDSEH